MDNPNFNDKCYRTKDDKLKATIWWKGNLADETAEERETRLANLRASRGTWVYDPVKREVVRKEEYIEDRQEINAPKVGLWNPEWSVMATGRRMSKGELKAYCKANGKELL